MTALRPGTMISILCLCAVACGRKTEAAKASDPNAPAVVRLPPPVIFSDTAKPDTMLRYREKVGAANSTLAQEYAVLGAAIVFSDRRMIASMYAPDAELVTPDSTYRGFVAVANRLASLGRTQSLREFNRRSRGLGIIDSVVTDSGTYVAITKRPGADSIVERGSYRTSWRIHAPPLHWVMTRDELHPSGKRGKGR